jgi:hypothetical protein
MSFQATPFPRPGNVIAQAEIPDSPHALTPAMFTQAGRSSLGKLVTEMKNA